MLRETAIEVELRRRVEAAGGTCEKTISLSSRGFFDRVVVLPGGRVVFAELKHPRGGRISAHQKARHARYKALGVEVWVIRSSSDIDRLLHLVGKNP